MQSIFGCVELTYLTHPIFGCIDSTYLIYPIFESNLLHPKHTTAEKSGGLAVCQSQAIRLEDP
jgi:hypothetical protein